MQHFCFLEPFSIQSDLIKSDAFILASGCECVSVKGEVNKMTYKNDFFLFALSFFAMLE